MQSIKALKEEIDLYEYCYSAQYSAKFHTETIWIWQKNNMKHCMCLNHAVLTVFPCSEAFSRLFRTVFAVLKLPVVIQ